MKYKSISTSGLIDFFFEIGSLNRIRRSSYHMTGMGDVSISEHSFRTAIIGYMLAKIQNADADRVLKMCLFHDIGESRCGDLNKVFAKYNRTDEKKAVSELSKSNPLLYEINDLYSEFARGESEEARLTREADILEQLLEEKELFDQGNKSMSEWMRFSILRLKDKFALSIGKKIVQTSSYKWWKNLIKTGLPKK